MLDHDLDEAIATHEFPHTGPGLYGLVARFYPDGCVGIDQFIDGSGIMDVTLSAREVEWLRGILGRSKKRSPREIWKAHWRRARKGRWRDTQDPVAAALLLARGRAVFLGYHAAGYRWKTQAWNSENWRTWTMRRTWHAAPKVREAIASRRAP